jgi:hypothetical protein
MVILDYIASGNSAVKTERVGFEPTVPLSGYTRFPVAPIRPLWHLSSAPICARVYHPGCT